MNGLNASEDSDSEVVSVSKHGQATIPKRFRETLGVSVPGKVRFRENEAGEIVVESVSSASEMRGFAKRRGEATTEKPATALLRKKRDQDKQEREAQFDDESEDV